ncbi:MAG: hypothetical protein JXA14_23375 [Anaerolineae bacterium]|nr:hypothetical protein [Anaerolineae bacterium]
MKMRKWRLILSTVVVLVVTCAGSTATVWSGPPVPPAETSPPENLALNPDRTGYPHPLDSDRGWGGGSDKWDIVDGVRRYSYWANGLAFTGGSRPWIEPCGWRQATIDFGSLQTFNTVMVWHHGQGQVPYTYKIQYWDQADSAWVDVFSTTSGHDYLVYPTDDPSHWWEGFSTPTENTFAPVTSDKVRFEFWNCDITHGWIYDFEVYYQNQPPVCSDAAPSVEQIWPANHKFETIEILGVIDPDGDPVSITVTGIHQDEPVDGEGDGSHVPDGRGVGSTTAEVRAERQGDSDGRVYHVEFLADDGRGGTCTGEVLVGVPHDKKDTAVDGGPLYDSTVANP